MLIKRGIIYFANIVAKTKLFSFYPFFRGPTWIRFIKKNSKHCLLKESQHDVPAVPSFWPDPSISHITLYCTVKRYPATPDVFIIIFNHRQLKIHLYTHNSNKFCSLQWRVFDKSGLAGSSVFLYPVPYRI